MPLLVYEEQFEATNVILHCFHPSFFFVFVVLALGVFCWADAIYALEAGRERTEVLETCLNTDGGDVVVLLGKETCGFLEADGLEEVTW